LKSIRGTYTVRMSGLKLLDMKVAMNYAYAENRCKSPLGA